MGVQLLSDFRSFLTVPSQNINPVELLFGQFINIPGGGGIVGLFSFALKWAPTAMPCPQTLFLCVFVKDGCKETVYSEVWLVLVSRTHSVDVQEFLPVQLFCSIFFPCC